MNTENQIKYLAKLIRKYKILYTIVIVLALLLTLTAGVFLYLLVVKKNNAYIWMMLVSIIISLLLTFIAIKIALKISSLDKLLGTKL